MYYVYNYEFRPELLEDKMSADTVEACSAECALRNRFFSVNKQTHQVKARSFLLL
jgi:hypothetical protein